MPTILLVDDTPVDRRLAGGILETDPTITIEYAEDGRQRIWLDAMNEYGIPRIQTPGYTEYQQMFAEAHRCDSALLNGRIVKPWAAADS